MSEKERTYKCHGFCGQKKYPKSQIKKYRGTTYCNKCYREMRKKDDEIRKLYITISNIYGIKFPTGQMLRQIKKYKEDRKYTYEGMRLALDYAFNVEGGHDPDDYISKGVALIPFYYDKAIKYFKDMENKKKHTYIRKLEPIHLTLPPLKIDTSYKQKKLIDMEALEASLKDVD